MPGKVDYEEVRRQFSIEQVASLLGLDGKKRGEQIRAKCPVTDSGELVITPSREPSTASAIAARPAGGKSSSTATSSNCHSTRQPQNSPSSSYRTNCSLSPISSTNTQRCKISASALSKL